MASEFVEPHIVRIPLSGTGRWIDVKKELNAGEFDAMMASIVAGENPTTGRPIQNFEKTPSHKIIAYVVGWSFTDSENKPIPVSAAAIANLKVKTRNEIRELVDAHHEASGAEIEARKNDQGDALESPSSSASVER